MKVWEALKFREALAIAEPGQVQRFQRRFGRLWCRARSGSTGFRRRLQRRSEALVQSQVRFKRVPEKTPEKIPGGFGAESGEVQEGSREVPEKVPEKVWEALVESEARFNRVPRKVPEKVLGGFGAEPGQVQQGSGEGSGVPTYSPKMPHVGPNSAANCPPTAPRCLMLAPTLPQIAHLQPQDASCWPQLCCKLPTYSPKMPHVGPNSATNCRPTAPRCLMLAPTLLQIAHLQPRCGRLWCRARSGSTGFRRRFWRRFQEALVQSQVGFNGVPRRLRNSSRKRVWESLAQGQVRTGFPALGFAARFRKIWKNKTLRLLGIQPKFILEKRGLSTFLGGASWS